MTASARHNDTVRPCRVTLRQALQELEPPTQHNKEGRRINHAASPLSMHTSSVMCTSSTPYHVALPHHTQPTAPPPYSTCMMQIAMVAMMPVARLLYLYLSLRKYTFEQGPAWACMAAVQTAIICIHGRMPDEACGGCTSHQASCAAGAITFLPAFWECVYCWCARGDDDHAASGKACWLHACILCPLLPFYIAVGSWSGSMLSRLSSPAVPY